MAGFVNKSPWFNFETWQCSKTESHNKEEPSQ
ncbi:hypothetical protein FOYG_11853 [Fusarium oxysporum NRRL 32931]|uniref:Uncharacterized protein n=2 Tax=Fusarium oxysporum TaxID=5507 RepID=W9HTV0_FUSOX|nr:hypothetical protein FOYG_11853 [Fusarium oxysporum NRRL 32931]EWZ30304.1 hypothetical protein FOZG_16464 [Fusarium oxysporum Fo47]EWZ97197.1 hypothetical protein FOWG_04393 [Fusarium oxysporum f. sp. lycopersici MN25]